MNSKWAAIVSPDCPCRPTSRTIGRIYDPLDRLPPPKSKGI